MRILAISHLFPNLKETRYGIFVARQLSEIRRLGAEITVIVPRVWCPGLLMHFDKWKNQDHKCPLCRFEGIETFSIPYLRLPGNFYNRWSGLAAYRAMRDKALELHKSKKFDVIYATDFFPDGDAAVRLARHLKIPAACLCIGVDVNITANSSKIINRHFEKTAKALDGTLACGHSVSDGIKAVTGKNPLCVYGVVDLEEFSPAPNKIPARKELDLPPDKTIALYAGYFTKRKGVYELLEAIYRVQQKHPDILLIMCGTGPEEKTLRRLIHEKGIEHKIHMTGEVEPEQMSKWMQASDLFVLASHTEGMPNVIMEAMACGLPVVATAVGGLPSAVGDCNGALLVPPGNVNELENAIVTIINDDHLMSSMGIAVRKRAEEQFGGKRNANLILDYLQNIVEEQKCSTAQMKQIYLVIDACQFTANYNYCLLDALAKRGERIVYATTKFAHGYIPNPPGIIVLRCFFFLARLAGSLTSSGPVRRFLRAIEYPLNLLFLLLYILIKRIKVAHLIWVVSPCLDYWFIRLLQLTGCRVVYTAHNPFPHEPKAGDIRKYSRIYQIVDHIIALTNYTRNEIMAHSGTSSEKISVLPHGDYEALFSRYGRNDELAEKVRQKAGGRKIIAFLGHIRPYKGLEVFVDSFQLIKQRMADSFFLIAGSVLVGDKKDWKEKLAESCKPDDLWADIRFVPVEDIKAYLSVIDILVQPYISASQSGNTIMAYAAGVPVISTNVGGLAEMTEDGKTGYIIAPRNSEAIADAISNCFEGDNYDKISHNAHQAASEKFNWEKIAEQTTAVYRQAIAKKTEAKSRA